MTQKESDQFKVVTGLANTSRFLEEVRTAADSHRDALGFFPASVFEEFAGRDHLYILIEERSNDQLYAGHLLFERRFPRAQVVQIFVLEQHRRHGLATKLIDRLKAALTGDGFTSIYARVAEDLDEANVFWDQQHFYVQRVEQGGTTRNRQILVRCHELESPQLFPTSGITAHNPLGLRVSSADVVPMFLLDLNVLFDLAPRRLRHDDALSLFQAERMSFCRLAISNEIREELRRTAYQGKTDPMEAYLRIFPSFPLSKGDNASALLTELTTLIFSDKRSERLTANEHSDLHHVATVIQHDLAGLITNDGSILAAAPKIASKYGVEIISPATFILDSSQSSATNSFQASEDATLALLDVSSQNESAVHSLLSKLGVTGSAIAATWLPTGAQARVANRRAVWDGATLLGYLMWSAKDSGDTVVARVAVDETSGHAASAARVLLIYLLEQLAPLGPRQIQLELASRQSVLRDLAIGFGFCGTPDQHCLGKFVLGRVLTAETWAASQTELSTRWGLKLPGGIPAYRSSGQQIQVLTPDGNQTHVALDVLETLLSPALLCLRGRPAVITPVQKSFSEPLLGHSPQYSLLARGTASLFHDRHYLSSPRTLQHFKRGTLILFYESTKQGGSGEVVAIARVREAYLKPADALDESDLKQSVLTTTSLGSIGKSDMRTVTVFDNIFRLPQHVPLESLKRIGCGRPNDLITTRVVTDAQLQQILKEAFNNG
ncbi:MAG: GNAT family N-acetyltransferase [Sulfuricaulis sp.]|uniref:GNAT family N-acetyltransferase n=1 Tax=Sulfuricaulis sp. TaxID=2003553 RepID=UPI0034A1240C